MLLLIFTIFFVLTGDIVKLILLLLVCGVCLIVQAGTITHITSLWSCVFVHLLLVDDKIA